MNLASQSDSAMELGIAGHDLTVQKDANIFVTLEIEKLALGQNVP